LLAPLEQLAGKIGYAVTYRQLSRADGLCDRGRRLIAVSDELAPNGQVSVLIHEVAHALVGPDRGLTRPVEEVVVEAVAYLGCAAAGLDTSCDSVPYIASYGDEQAIDTLKEAAELIDALARRIERALGIDEEPTAESAAA
jgi:hypothetical protein